MVLLICANDEDLIGAHLRTTRVIYVSIWTASELFARSVQI